MVTVHITKDKKYALRGKFDFYISPMIFDKRFLQPYRRVSFSFSAELPQDLETKMSETQVLEMISEKLRKDFVKTLKSNSFRADPIFKKGSPLMVAKLKSNGKR